MACNRAAAAAKLGKHEQALADAELALELDPNYAKAFVRRAQVSSFVLCPAGQQGPGRSWLGSKHVGLGRKRGEPS